jgi:signal transduction histidine kinase
MPTRRGGLTAGLARLGRWPARTIRLRLTLVYGGLFLVLGTALLAIGYLLVLHVLPDPATLHHVLPHVPAALRQRVVSQDSQERGRELHQLLTESLLVLAVMAVISAGLGWLVAGRALRPLRRITASARNITARNLHERLALGGPADELKELGDTIDGLLGRLERSFQAQRQFVANASHELLTPLTLEQALLEAALSDPAAKPESWRDTCEKVLAASRHQARLIDALLALARSDAGLDRHCPARLDHIAAQVLNSRRAGAQARRLNMVTSLAPAPTSGDPRLIERLVTNLIDNALRHNVGHGVVEVTTSTAGRRAVISVANTGPLVPAGDITRLFQPFQRRAPDRTGSDEGLGLGLSIVHAIATAHDAQIEAGPGLQGGLTVVIGFPADQVEMSG